MRLARLAPLLLLLLVGAAAWLLLNDGGGGVADPADLSASGTSDTAAGLPPAAEAGDGPLLARSSAAADAAAPTVEDPFAGYEGPRARVRVRHLITREPVPCATIWVFDPDHYDERALLAAVESDRDWERAAPAFARKVAADEQGEALVPQPRAWHRLLGRSENLYGETHHAPGADGEIVQLLLEPDLLVLARAVDADGRGMPGAMLGLRLREGQDAQWVLEQAADSDGRTAFRHLQRHLLWRSPGARLELTPVSPFRDPPLVALEIGALPTEEQVLAYPATGSVTVRLLDPDRRPFRGRATVVLQTAGAEAGGWGEDDGFYESAIHGARSLVTKDGLARFDHVGLELALELGVDFDGTGIYEATACSGPARGGDEVFVDAVQRVLRPVLRARILGADGQPVRDADIQLSLSTIGASWINAEHADGRTDADGILLHALTPSWVETRADAERYLDLAWEPDPGAAVQALRLPARASWNPGENDHGDLRLAALPLLAGGLVVDERGAPIAGAEVRLLRRVMRRNRESWQQDRSVTATSGPDGAFRMLGFPRAGICRLQAHHADYSLSQEDWRAGASDHRLMLKQGSLVHGRILLDPAIAPRAIRVIAIPSDAEDKRSSYQAALDQAGDFRISGAPERCNVVIWDERTERALLQVDGVAATPAGAPPDPRLDPLDLRGVLRYLDVRCVGADGQTIAANLNYVLSRESAWPGEFSAWSDGGAFRVLTADLDWTVWVDADGHRRASAPLLEQGLEIPLRRGPRVVWRLADPGLYDLSEQLWLEIAFQAGGEQEETDWCSLSRETEPTSDLGEAGSYRVRLYTLLTDEIGENSWAPYPQEGWEIQILDTAEEQTLLLPWTVAEILASREGKPPE